MRCACVDVSLHVYRWVASWQNGVYGPTEVLHVKYAPQQSLPSSETLVLPSSVSYVFIYLFICFACLCTSKVNLLSLKYACSVLGVNHHLVFNAYSLSGCSRCARGMWSYRVKCVHAAFGYSQASCSELFPSSCHSSLFVFLSKGKLWLAQGLFATCQSTRLT